MSKYRKAITAAIAAGAAAYGTAMQDGQVTTLEWITIVGAAVLAGAAVWGVANKEPATGQR